MTAILTRASAWFRSVLHRRDLEQDMEEELHFHIEARTADLIRNGIAAPEARRQARLEFGSVATHQDGIRASLGLRWLDDIVTDIAYAVRVLRRSPGFTAVAVTSLALAIGANTAIFSIANETLYERLNVPNAKQLRILSIHDPKNGVVTSSWGDWMQMDDGTYRIGVFTYPVYQLLAKNNHVLQPIFAFKDIGRGNVAANGQASSGKVEMVSGNLYAQLGIKPQLGRTIVNADDASSQAVAVISDGYWTQTFNRNPNVLGQTISVNSVPFTVIGVNPRGFTGASSVQTSPDVFVPLSAITQLRPPSARGGPWLTNPDVWWVQLMARAQDGVSDTQAQAALNTALAAAVHATIKVKSTEVVPTLMIDDGSRGLNQAARTLSKPIYVLLTMTAFVLLLACANIANLMLARAATRHREMGIRMALGASRARVMRQVLTENLLIAILGGIFGLALGMLGSTLLPRLLMSAWEKTAMELPFNWHLFAFTAALTVLTGLIFGAAPAWQATRSSVGTALKEGARAATRRSRGLSGKAIVGVQVALATLLVAGAALFLQTLWKLNRVEPGFAPHSLVLFDLLPPKVRYPAPQDIALHQRIEQALANVPGVTAVSAADIALIANSRSISGFKVEGQPDIKSNDDMANNSRMIEVGQTYFQTMGIPIIAGRPFNLQDTHTSKRVSVINRALATLYFPNDNPLGKRFRIGNDPESPWIEIVGIAENIRYASLREDAPPMHFDLYNQDTSVGPLTYNIRSALPLAVLAPMLQRAVAQIDPDIPVLDLRTQQQQIDDSLQTEHMFASLTAGFGILALALAIVGIYGMMSYRVTQRTQEMGVRIALGAEPRQVRNMVLGEALWTGASGVVAGVVAVVILLRVVKSLLYGAGPSTAAPVASAALLLLIVTILSAWIPATRIARLEPSEALRHE